MGSEQSTALPTSLAKTFESEISPGTGRSTEVTQSTKMSGTDSTDIEVDSTAQTSLQSLDITKTVKYPCLILKPDGSSTTFPAHPEVGSHARFKDWSLGSAAGGSTVEIVVDFTIHNESYIDVEMTFSNN